MDQDVWTLETMEHVQLSVAHCLQDSGLTIPSQTTSGAPSSPPILNPIGRFGLPLDWDYQETLPCVFESAQNKYSFQLPKVFVECVSFLKSHTEEEGLFRKAGSVSRQKAIRLALEDGRNIPEDANVHDVAGVLKKYLRMLPDPLLTKQLTPLFEACLTLSANEQPHNLLLACLLLPSQNIQCLCVLMDLLSRVSRRQSDSLMSSNNLGIIMAPNLLHIPSETPQEMAASGRALLAHTKVVTLLIEHSSSIGRVPCELMTRPLPSEGDEGMSCIVQDEAKKQKNNRSGSLSGKVLGLGSRLKGRGSSALPGDHKSSSTMKKRGRSQDHLLSRPKGKMKNSLLSNVEELRRSLHCGSSRHKAPPRPQIIRPAEFRFNPPLSIDCPAVEALTTAVESYPNTTNCPVVDTGNPSTSSLLKPESVHGSVTISPIATDRHANCELDFKFSPPMDCSLDSSVRKSFVSSDFDQAFIKTPFPGVNSPNLLDKIKSELEFRQPWQKPGISNLSRVNESYKKAVSGVNPITTQSSIRSYRLVDKKSPVYTAVSDDTAAGNCPPLALSFNSSEVESNKSLPLGTVDAPIETPNEACGRESSAKTPASPASKRLSVDKLSVPMKPVTNSHTMRKRFDYSATLGIAMGESLVQVRDEHRSEQRLSPLSKSMHNHSACLGMSGLERDTLRRASKRVYPKKVTVEPSKKDAIQRLCDLHSPSATEGGSQVVAIESPHNCSGSALIKILDRNMEKTHRKMSEQRSLESVKLTRRPLNHSLSQTVFNQELDRATTGQSSIKKTPFKRVPWLSQQTPTQKARATVYEVGSTKQNHTSNKQENSGKENPLKEWLL